MIRKNTGIAASVDDLRVVYILGTVLRWSDRRIARIIRHHHNTVSIWRREANSQIESGELSISTEVRARCDVIPVGGSTELERLDGCVNHRNKLPSTQLPEDNDECNDDAEDEVTSEK